MTAEALKTTELDYEVLGYRVEKIEKDSAEIGVAYLLHGPRGARYALLRNVSNPHMLYAWNDRTFRCVALKGNSWFTDKDGILKAVSYHI